MGPLTTLHRCVPSAGALAPDALPQWLAQVSQWSVVDGALQREITCDDYPRLMSFVNAVAWLAQREDHHPELAVGHRTCTVRWRTHSADALTVNDFICAAKVDALLS